MSISLIHNIFCKVCSPVHFLIQGNVTLGLMLPFAVNVTPNLLLPRSLPSIRNRRITLTAKSKHHVEVLQLLKLGNQQIKTKKIILKDKPGMNQCLYFWIVKINTKWQIKRKLSNMFQNGVNRKLDSKLLDACVGIQVYLGTNGNRPGNNYLRSVSPSIPALLPKIPSWFFFQVPLMLCTYTRTFLQTIISFLDSRLSNKPVIYRDRLKDAETKLLFMICCKHTGEIE